MSWLMWIEYGVIEYGVIEYSVIEYGVRGNA